ncbi:MAG: RHS repeat protein, partial [Lentisphaerae bacterium]|nr:RHS repeat protein [Lentisphaerota bacterium]
MNKHFILSFVASAALIAPLASNGGGNMRTNPPSECKAPDKKCDCPGGAEVSAGCIKVNLDLGQTTPWSGSMDCALKIFADNESPNVFTCDSLYAVLGGYTFKRLGQKTLGDGVTPAEVVFSHPNGEPISFVFKNGESLAQPDPGVHVKMDERLMMIDAEGWATTSDPVYYDLYLGDGSRRRFMATDMFGGRGKLVSVTDARGVTVTPAEMGVDIVYDSNGVRQFLTPSRLANIVQHTGFTGYDVTVYPIQDRPAKDAATGLYDVPSATPVKRLTLRRENGGKRAVVTLRSGDAEPKEYVFDYVMRDWSLIHPSGAQDQKEIYADDEREACTISTSLSADGRMMSRSEAHYKWESWGYAMTNRVEGFDGATNVTEWTYYTSGNGKGQVKTEKRQSGLLIQYTYDASDRVISETRSGPDMMTETTTYDYTPVDPSDPVLPVDTRPRTVVKTLNGIECERTYYVYSLLTNIVERVGTQGAPYGSTDSLRTVTTFYPAGGPTSVSAASGLVRSIRHENGKLDLYDYELASNTWIRTITHLHEQSHAPVSGKTTRDITVTNARGEVVETRTEAMIDGIWYTISRNRMTYNIQGKRITSENLAGQVTTTAWDCCHKVSEVQPDGSTTTWDYDDEGRMIASSRLIPLDMTNVTWLTTCYRYDALGRQTATWQTNYAAQVGLPVARTRYDQLGRVKARVDQLGNTTTTTYSPDGRTVFV